MDVTVPCICDESTHESDTVTLRDKLDFHRSTTITKAISFIPNDDPATRPAEVLATLSEYYVLMGVERWTARAHGKPVPISSANIREVILGRPEVASIVADAADSLYEEAILLPLVRKAENSSRPSPTAKPTSARPRGGPQKPPKPSKPSSISTIPTVGIETTSSSLVGVSNSSQSSESAA